LYRGYRVPIPDRPIGLLSCASAFHSTVATPPDYSMNHSKDPLHGVTLEKVVTALVDHFGWDELGRIIDIRCFNFEPSISSSLKFLRKTPWARKKVEELYLSMLSRQERDSQRDPG
jgi:uncharacterized protein (DUF2132 family)